MALRTAHPSIVFVLLWRRLVLALQLIAVALTAMACAFGDDTDAIGLISTTGNSHLYVVGRYANGASLWVIDDRFKIRYSLPNPSGFLGQSQAMACVFDNGVLYISGWVETGPGFWKPCVWIDGVPSMLDDMGLNTTPNGTGIAVRKGHVVVTGRAGANQACYWFDGVPTLLPQPPWANSSMAYAARFYNDHLIIGGMAQDPGLFSQACYWINGVYNPLGNIENERVTGIDIYQGILYGTGPGGTNSCLKNWIGQEAFQYEVNPMPKWANGIKVHGGVPYTVGYTDVDAFQTATLWINGAPSYLISNMLSSANGITIVEGYKGFPLSIIVAGGYYNGTSSACLWINGTRLELDSSGAVFNETVANDVCTGTEITLPWKR